MTNIQSLDKLGTSYPIPRQARDKLSNLFSRISNIPASPAGRQYPISNILLIVLLIIGFILRIWGLDNNWAMWSDETYVAVTARAILEKGRPELINGYSTGTYQWLLYWLTAGSMKIFGLNEIAGRLPTVIFGTATIGAVYWLGKAVFDRKTGLLAAFLTTFLTIEILFSRQLRPYQHLQFFYLTAMYFAFRISQLKGSTVLNFFGLITSGILAALTHGLGLLILPIGLAYLILTGARMFGWRKIILGSILLVILILANLRDVWPNLLNLGKINFLYYYRVFLTHNYLPLVILAVMGGISLVIAKNWRAIVLFGLVLGTQLFMVSFILGQPFTRYLYIVFPFMVLLASYGGMNLVNWLTSLLVNKLEERRIGWIGVLGGLVILGVLGGYLIKTDKLVLWPRTIYSLNADMQEVPEVDWQKIYGFVNDKIAKEGKVAVVANWNDIAIWYLGEGRLDYIVQEKWKWNNDRDPVSGAKIINSLDEFINVTKKDKAGYFVLDSWDNQIPAGVREYCRQNLKKELEIDRLYPVQPRYWPVMVYSWGMGEQ